MTAPLTLYFVRHGEVHNPEGILYGRRPNLTSAFGQDKHQPQVVIGRISACCYLRSHGTRSRNCATTDPRIWNYRGANR
jgi:hypothetical protein